MSTGDPLFQNIMETAKKKPKKPMSIRVDKETELKFDKLCKKHKVVKAEIYSWALNEAIRKIEEEYE